MCKEKAVTRFEADEAFFRSFDMIDRELRLSLANITNASHPDEQLQQCCFSMIDAQSESTMGQLSLRLGYTENVVRYRGNIGFSVSERFRGKALAARSCLLLLPILKTIKLSPIWITCNVGNEASRKSIERTGADYVETVKILDSYEYYDHYPPEAKVKLRFRWDIS
jgi:tagatose 1,6-diphosphate aldolase